MRYKENVNVMEVCFFRSHLLPALELAKPGQLLQLSLLQERWPLRTGFMAALTKTGIIYSERRFFKKLRLLVPMRSLD